VGKSTRKLKVTKGKKKSGERGFLGKKGMAKKKGGKNHPLGKTDKFKKNKEAKVSGQVLIEKTEEGAEQWARCE